jgi:hypothetical protein
MLIWMAGLGERGEQPADLSGGQRDEVSGAGRAAAITPRAWRRKFSTAAGAPFELR